MIKSILAYHFYGFWYNQLFPHLFSVDVYFIRIFHWIAAKVAKVNIAPLIHCTLVIYFLQIDTKTKSIASYTCHTIWDHYTSQVAATIECTIANVCHTIWDHYTLQVATPFEYAIAYACHTTWNYYICCVSIKSN